MSRITELEKEVLHKDNSCEIINKSIHRENDYVIQMPPSFVSSTPSCQPNVQQSAQGTVTEIEQIRSVQSTESDHGPLNLHVRVDGPDHNQDNLPEHANSHTNTEANKVENRKQSEKTSDGKPPSPLRKLRRDQITRTPKHLVLCFFLRRRGHCVKGLHCDFAHMNYK